MRLNNIDDSILIEAISINDDEQSYRILFERYYAPLCVFAKRYILAKEIREDIVEEVFTNLWEKRKHISISSSTRNYLITSVRNVSLNYIRKENYKIEYDNKINQNENSFVENTDELYTLKELEELLDKALMKLPKEYRLAFEMSYNKDMSMDEIAKYIGVSVRTAERYKNKATEILKNELKDYLPLITLLLYRF